MSAVCRTWGHRYEPRYSVIRNEQSSHGCSEKHSRKIYEGDVCRRCGDTIDGRGPDDSLREISALSDWNEHPERRAG